MTDNPGRVLAVGLRDGENEELRRFLEQHGSDVWFAHSAVGAYRVFEEVKPQVLVIDTELPDADAERAARVLAAADPSLRVTFVGSHHIEAPYFAGLEGFEHMRFCHRPLDPEAVFGVESELAEVGGVPLRGDLTAERFVRLLVALEQADQHGVLYVGTGSIRRVVYFRNGRPIYATSTVLDENFGQFLLQKGRISPVEFHWARSLQLKEGVRQGDALVKIGVLKSSELHDLLQEQIRLKITNVLWLDGEPYHFDAWDRPLRNVLGYDFNVLSLVVDGVLAGSIPSHAAAVPGRAKRVVLPDASAALANDLRDLVGPELFGAMREKIVLDDVASAMDGPDRAAALVASLMLAGVVELDEGHDAPAGGSFDTMA